MGDVMNSLSGLSGSLGNLGSLVNLDALANLGGSFSLEGILGQIGAYFNGLIAKLVAMVPAQVMEFYNTHKVLFLLAIICILGVVAFEGYRFFRVLTYAGSAFLFGLVGYWYIAPKFAGQLQSMIPEIVDYSVAVAVACSLLAVILCYFAFNLVIFLLGGAAGYILGSTLLYGYMVATFNSLEFLKAENVKHIVGGVIAVIAALVFALMFKILFMFATSFGCSIGAAIILKNILVPGGDDNVKIAFIVLGVVIGIITLIRQRKQEDNIIFRI